MYCIRICHLSQKAITVFKVLNPVDEVQSDSHASWGCLLQGTPSPPSSTPFREISNSRRGVVVLAVQTGGFGLKRERERCHGQWRQWMLGGQGRSCCGARAVIRCIGSRSCSPLRLHGCRCLCCRNLAFVMFVIWNFHSIFILICYNETGDLTGRNCSHCARFPQALCFIFSTLFADTWHGHTGWICKRTVEEILG